MLNFLDKEDKWFGSIRGSSTGINDIDLKNFSVQGLGTIKDLEIEVAPYTITPSNISLPDEIDLNEFPKVVADGLDGTCLSKADNKGTQIGVIAQELEEILPDCVITDENKGNKEVNSDPILWYLVNAVKELSVKVTALEAG